MKKKYYLILLILLLSTGLPLGVGAADFSYNVSIRNWDLESNLIYSPDVRINTTPLDDDYFNTALSQDVAYSKGGNTIYVRFQSQCLNSIPNGCVTVTAYYSEAAPGLDPDDLDPSGATWLEIGSYIMNCQFPPDITSPTPGLDDRFFPGEWYPRTHEEGLPSLYSVVCAIDCNVVLPFAYYLKVEVDLTCYTDEDLTDNVAYSYYDQIGGVPPVDVVLAIDCSGSMLDEITMVKDRAKYFIDLMNVNDRVGVVAFSDFYPLKARQIFSLQYIQSLDETNSQHTAMDTQINNLNITSAAWMTPMGSGVILARDALISVPPDPAENQAIILLTDGKENVGPYVKDPPAYTILNSLNTHDIALYPLWFGSASDWGLSLLEDIATEVDEYKLVDQPLNDLKLAKSYLMIRGILTDDDVYDIHEGITGDNYATTVQTDSLTHELILTTAWQNLRNNLYIEVMPPGNSNWVDAASLNPIVLQGDAYRIYRFRNPSRGIWNYRLKQQVMDKQVKTNLQVQTKEPYILAALADKVEILMQSKLKKNAVRAGEPLTVYATLTQMKKPLHGAKVTAKVRIPDVSLGSVLLKYRDKIDQIPAIQGTDISRGDMITMNLPNMIGKKSLVSYNTITIELFDDGEHGDSHAGDGIYTGRINTKIAGTYRIVIEATQGPDSDVVFQRQHEHIGIVNLGKIDPKKTIVTKERVPDNVKGFDVWKVSATPVDIYGNACFPGFSDDIHFSSNTGIWENTLIDNQDGSYTQVLKIPEGVTPSIGVTAFGEEVGIDESAAKPVTDYKPGEISIHSMYYFVTETNFSDTVIEGPGMIVDLGFAPIPCLAIIANFGLFRTIEIDSRGTTREDIGYSFVPMLNLNLQTRLNFPKVTLFAQAGAGLFFAPDGKIPSANIGAGLHIPISSHFSLSMGGDYFTLFPDFDNSETLKCILLHAGCIIKW